MHRRKQLVTWLDIISHEKTAYIFFINTNTYKTYQKSVGERHRKQNFVMKNVMTYRVFDINVTKCGRKYG